MKTKRVYIVFTPTFDIKYPVNGIYSIILC